MTFREFMQQQEVMGPPMHTQMALNPAGSGLGARPLAPTNIFRLPSLDNRSQYNPVSKELTKPPPSSFSVSPKGTAIKKRRAPGISGTGQTPADHKPGSSPFSLGIKGKPPGQLQSQKIGMQQASLSPSTQLNRIRSPGAPRL